MELYIAVLILASCAQVFAATSARRSPGSCPKRHAGPTFVQLGLERTQELAHLAAFELPIASWVAESFEDCVRSSNFQKQNAGRFGPQWRSISCQNARDGQVLPVQACARLPRPRRLRRCNCGVQLCLNSSDAEPSEEEKEQEPRADASGPRGHRFAHLGCLSKDEDQPAAPSSEDAIVHDTSCVDWKVEQGVCRLGLPFYRLAGRANLMSPTLCFKFCRGKGLDLFGVISKTECRCGASALNRQAWNWMPTPRPGLGLPWAMLRTRGTEACDMEIYRYTGNFQDSGAMPDVWTELTIEDEAYLDSLGSGKFISPEEEEDIVRDALPSVEVEPSLALKVLLQSNSSSLEGMCTGCPCANVNYPCYAWYSSGSRCACFKIGTVTTPENCANAVDGTFCLATSSSTTSTTTSYTGPSTTTTLGEVPPAGQGWSRSGSTSQAGKIWPDRQADPPSGEDVWEEYVVIHYTFDTSVDPTRKDAFRKAVDMWRNATCINFVEQATAQKPYVLVGIFDEGSCFANLGYSSWYESSGNARVNLGWCKDSRHVGSMAHELGHILGMSHEQKRPDGAGVYFGRGPHLIMYWQNVPDSWKSQYTGSSSSYTGSADDGAGDPQRGYAEYDFGSIMHYGGGSRFDTIPADKESIVGNRYKLSPGDIKQIFDVYECKAKNGGATTSTASSTTAPTSTTTTTTTTTITTTTTTTITTSAATTTTTTATTTSTSTTTTIITSTTRATTTSTTTSVATLTTTDGAITVMTSGPATTTTSSGAASLFVPLRGDGSDQVCRGAHAGDNLASYYTLIGGKRSLEACKAECLRLTETCVGIESSSSGRCEVWTRAQGVGMTSVLFGYTCLVFKPSLPATTTMSSSLFRPLSGKGTNQACRGRTAGDNLDSYYSVFDGMASLRACKSACMAYSVAPCRGVEYHPTGRCEIWTRSDGIGMTITLAGYTCLAYGPEAPSSTTTTFLTADPSLFKPIIGDGTSQACRGSTTVDNLPTYYSVLALSSLDACMASCMAHVATSATAAARCQGIEYSGGRCEIWTRPDGIGFTQAMSGFTCLLYRPAVL